MKKLARASSLGIFSLLSLFLTLLTNTAVSEPDPGHSHQGPAFDHGPRRFAVLSHATGPINFAEESCSQDARDFINQGIGQLHGFLNFESERSFRQAAYIEPTCAMAYWGMAMANTIWATNGDRALEFNRNAADRLGEANSDRERRYIDAVQSIESDRSGFAFANHLRNIWRTYPEDLDAKAFYVMTVWWKGLHAQMGYSGTSVREKNWPLYQLAQEVLAAEPLHPVHHYIIHMWDNSHFAYALDSADQNGFSAPGVAHMWHMAGHTYHQAGMLFEKWWSQEAAARVDHRDMASSGIFPFMLHNHAHNNEWFSRTLQETGSFEKSIRVGGNLLAQPRHPVFNQVTQYQHLQSGVNRVLDGIERGEYWTLGRTLFDSPLLQCEEYNAHSSTYQKCLRVRALTAVMSGSQPSQEDLAHMHTNFASEVRLVALIAQGQTPQNAIYRLSGLSHLNQNGAWEFQTLARYARSLGRSSELLAKARSFLGPVNMNVPAFLEAAFVLHSAGKINEAQTVLARVQDYSQETDFAAPVLQALTSAFALRGISIGAAWKKDFANWRSVHSSRPLHTDLGPLLWQIPEMSNITFTDMNRVETNLADALAGGPAVVVFSLAECSHCDLQLQDLIRKEQELANRGVRLIGILSTPENLAAFRAAGVFDEFESIPLHGLFILDSERRIMWQDIAADVFSDVEFLMLEIDRALHPLTNQGLNGNWDL